MQERQVHICYNPHSIVSAKTDMIKWSEEAKKKAKIKTAFPYFSLNFPAILSCFEV